MVKKTKFMKVVDWVLNILLVVSFIIMMYFILWKIFGNSPTDFQVVSWVIGLLSMVVFKLFSFTYNINRDMNGVKKDIGEIKNLVKKK